MPLPNRYNVTTAAAALALYRAHRGDRPVVAVIYTHSHVDHFGGVLGVTSQADVDAGKVAVIAPEGFVQHAVQENVYAGTAMARRASYMYGTLLERGPRGIYSGAFGCLGVDGTADLAMVIRSIIIDEHGSDAVAAAYGWPADLDDDTVLTRLGDLNRVRAG